MKLTKLSILALGGLIAWSLVGPDPGWAKPGSGNGNGNQAPSAVVESEDPDTVTADILTGDRVALLVEIIYATDDTYTDVISEDLRLAILDDRDALPPGIERQLARGRGLPPGIAKKYQMPRSVLTILELDPDTEIWIVGRYVVVMDPAEVVLDFVEALL